MALADSNDSVELLIPICFRNYYFFFFSLEEKGSRKYVKEDVSGVS